MEWVTPPEWQDVTGVGVLECLTPGEGERPPDGGPCLPVPVPPVDPLRGYEVLPDPAPCSVPCPILLLVHIIITCSSLPHKSIVEPSWGDGM